MRQIYGPQPYGSSIFCYWFRRRDSHASNYSHVWADNFCGCYLITFFISANSGFQTLTCTLATKTSGYTFHRVESSQGLLSNHLKVIYLQMVTQSNLRWFHTSNPPKCVTICKGIKLNLRQFSIRCPSKWKQMP
jgi:hypothetical protein